jgi:small GTP-binding protein
MDDWILKLLMIGDTATGKSSLTLKYCKNEFHETYMETIGVDFLTKRVMVYDKGAPTWVGMQVWDIGAQQRFDSIRPPFYRGAMACAVVVDTTRKETLGHVPAWLDEMYKVVEPVIPTVLLLNKSDLKDERKMDDKNVRSVLNKINNTYPGYKEMPVKVFETSAKEGKNVELAFTTLAILATETPHPY